MILKEHGSSYVLHAESSAKGQPSYLNITTCLPPCLPAFLPSIRTWLLFLAILFLRGSLSQTVGKTTHVKMS